DVVELVPAVIAWARGPIVEIFGGSLDDVRVRLIEDDVSDVIRARPGAYDAILLDVDNGPDGLTRPANDAIYTSRGLAEAKAALRPGGVLAIWCQGAHAGLWADLQALSASAREERHVVQRGRHRIAYVIYTVRADR
ncbi:MAG TPA: hypothetical protein VFR88_11420, partial [Microlunatus sp.]|nr:hypothetical protein [Microlunatus sp.]